jgi:hypothetical protein
MEKLNRFEISHPYETTGYTDHIIKLTFDAEMRLLCNQSRAGAELKPPQAYLPGYARRTHQRENTDVSYRPNFRGRGTLYNKFTTLFYTDYNNGRSLQASRYISTVT